MRFVLVIRGNILTARVLIHAHIITLTTGTRRNVNKKVAVGDRSRGLMVSATTVHHTARLRMIDAPASKMSAMITKNRQPLEVAKHVQMVSSVSNPKWSHA